MPKRKASRGRRGGRAATAAAKVAASKDDDASNEASVENPEEILSEEKEPSELELLQETLDSVEVDTSQEGGDSQEVSIVSDIADTAELVSGEGDAEATESVKDAAVKDCELVEITSISSLESEPVKKDASDADEAKKTLREESSTQESGTDIGGNSSSTANQTKANLEGVASKDSSEREDEKMFEGEVNEESTAETKMPEPMDSTLTDVNSEVATQSRVGDDSEDGKDLAEMEGKAEVKNDDPKEEVDSNAVMDTQPAAETVTDKDRGTDKSETSIDKDVKSGNATVEEKRKETNQLSLEQEWSEVDGLEAVSVQDETLDDLPEEAEVSKIISDEEEEEEEEIQYVDEEADDEQQLLDLISGGEGESDGNLRRSGQGPVSKPVLSSVKSGQDAGNSKFEEISEGSIPQAEQYEVINESFSDVEITGESFTTFNKKLNEKTAPRTRKGEESLEEVFFATENDDLKVTAEDKDNDDISDASLPDHEDANMSLEEISDEDVDISKKRRKSTEPSKSESVITPAEAAGPDSAAPVKDSGSEKKTDGDGDVGKSVEGSEKSSEEKRKRSLSAEDQASAGGPPEKQQKLSQGEDQTSGTPTATQQRSSPGGEGGEAENLAAFFTNICGVRKTDNKQGSNSSHPAKANPEVPKRSVNDAPPTQQQTKPQAGYMADVKKQASFSSSACQTEPRNMKGKIVQCNINPIKAQPARPVDDLFDDGGKDSSKFLEQFREKLPYSIPGPIISKITSQPSLQDNWYTLGLGPVSFADMESPELRDNLLKKSDKFSLIFDEDHHGIYKAAVKKQESVASLIRQLKRLELGNRYMTMSLAYGQDDTKGGKAFFRGVLSLMYDQDVQSRKHSARGDAKLRAKLQLAGVPEGVSKDLVHLLFPEALSISSSPTFDNKRCMVLGFSNQKVAQDVILCHDLVVINGQQVTISALDYVESSTEAESQCVVDGESMVLIDVASETEGPPEERSVSSAADASEGVGPGAGGDAGNTASVTAESAASGEKSRSESGVSLEKSAGDAEKGVDEGIPAGDKKGLDEGKSTEDTEKELDVEKFEGDTEKGLDVEIAAGDKEKELDKEKSAGDTEKGMDIEKSAGDSEKELDTAGTEKEKSADVIEISAEEKGVEQTLLGETSERNVGILSSSSNTVEEEEGSQLASQDKTVAEKSNTENSSSDVSKEAAEIISDTVDRPLSETDATSKETEMPGAETPSKQSEKENSNEANEPLEKMDIEEKDIATVDGDDLEKTNADDAGKKSETVSSKEEDKVGDALASVSSQGGDAKPSDESVGNGAEGVGDDNNAVSAAEKSDVNIDSSAATAAVTETSQQVEKTSSALIALASYEDSNGDKDSEVEKSADAASSPQQRQAALSKSLEDVSDEEMVAQQDKEDPSAGGEVQILREDSSTKVIAEIDLTLEDSTASDAEEKSDKTGTGADGKQEAKTKKSKEASPAGNAGSSAQEEKLHMTDGEFEIDMEVIDVDDGVTTSEKVMYARKSPRRSRERSRSSRDRSRGGSHGKSYTRGSDRDYVSRRSPSGRDYPSQSQYKFDRSRWSPVPSRESTAQRRDNYRRRSRSPVPSSNRDSNWYRDAHPPPPRQAYYPPAPKQYPPYQYRAPYPGPDQQQRKPSYESRPPQYYAPDAGRPPAYPYGPPPPREPDRRPSEHYHQVPSKDGERGAGYNKQTSPSWRGAQYDRRREFQVPHSYQDSRRVSSPPPAPAAYKKRRSRSRSLSDMSMDSDPPVRPAAKKASRGAAASGERATSSSIKRKPVSRSPISISSRSRSRSLSPVSRSPSPDPGQLIRKQRAEIFKSVKQFLHAARDIQHSVKSGSGSKRRSGSRSPPAPPATQQRAVVSSSQRRSPLPKAYSGSRKVNYTSSSRYSPATATGSHRPARRSRSPAPQHSSSSSQRPARSPPPQHHHWTGGGRKHASSPSRHQQRRGSYRHHRSPSPVSSDSDRGSPSPAPPPQGGRRSKEYRKGSSTHYKELSPPPPASSSRTGGYELSGRAKAAGSPPLYVGQRDRGDKDRGRQGGSTWREEQQRKRVAAAATETSSRQQAYLPPPPSLPPAAFPQHGSKPAYPYGPSSSSSSYPHPAPNVASSGYNPQASYSHGAGNSGYQQHYGSSSSGAQQYATPSSNPTPPTETNPHVTNAYQQAFSILKSAIGELQKPQQPPPQQQQQQQSYASHHYRNPPHPGTSASGQPPGPAASAKSKSWSMGSNALVFQRILGSEGASTSRQSGGIDTLGHRERHGRPKHAKEVRVLTEISTKK